MRIVTSFTVLMQKAKALGDAKKSGDSEAIAEAQADHDAYKELCLTSNEMITGHTFGTFYERKST